MVTEEILNQVLIAQSTEQLGAEPYERSDDRTAYRNGFRDKELTTRLEPLHFVFQDTEMAISALPCLKGTSVEYDETKVTVDQMKEAIRQAGYEA